MSEPYEIFNMTITLNKKIHISCVEDTVKELKNIGEIISLDMSYFIDNSPRFGKTSNIEVVGKLETNDE